MKSNRQLLKNILDFAHENNLMDKSFVAVFKEYHLSTIR